MSERPRGRETHVDAGFDTQVRVRAAALLLGTDLVGETNPLPITLISSSEWTASWKQDEAANDSDKTFAVPANTEWHLLTAWVEYTSNGVAGNRQLEIQLQDSTGDVKLEIRPDITQAASITRYYLFGPSMGDLDAFRDTDWLSTPMPPTLILPPGSQIRVWDNNAVSAAGDDMQVHLLIALRSV